jgi:hypothetical protein
MIRNDEERCDYVTHREQQYAFVVLLERTVAVRIFYPTMASSLALVERNNDAVTALSQATEQDWVNATPLDVVPCRCFMFQITIPENFANGDRFPRRDFFDVHSHHAYPVGVLMAEPRAFC